MSKPRALTIAGSDSSGRAGVQADLRTFEALGVTGLSAVSAVTAQAPCRVVEVHAVPPGIVAAQIRAAGSEGDVRAVKTGMLPNRAVAEAAAGAIRGLGTANLVVDPLIFASSGGRLASRGAVDLIAQVLFPAAAVITPNLSEAEYFARMPVECLEDMKRAAKILAGLGPGCVVITGGHLKTGPIDVFYDGSSHAELPGSRIGIEMRGTGCIFSAAIAAFLARGTAVYEAVVGAKRYVEAVLRAAEKNAASVSGSF